MQFARASKCSMIVYTVFLQQQRLLSSVRVKYALGRAALKLGYSKLHPQQWKCSSKAAMSSWGSSKSAKNGYALLSSRLVLCTCTPGSPPSLNGARYVYTPQESRYFHAPITSLESCNLIGSNRFLPGGLDSGQVFPDRIFPASACACEKIGLARETRYYLHLICCSQCVDHERCPDPPLITACLHLKLFQ